MIIYGIGDEIIGVAVAFTFTALVTIIWRSTHVQERPPVQAVVIRAAATSTSSSSETGAITQTTTTATLHVLHQHGEILDASDATEEAIVATNNSTANSDDVEEQDGADSAEGADGAEGDGTVGDSFGDANQTTEEIENLNATTTTSTSEDHDKATSNKVKRESDIRSHQGESSKESPNSEATTSTPSQSQSAEKQPSDVSNPDMVTIKVRFIDETSIEVKEKLAEKLGRFVSKHLDSHLNLTSDDRVKLIYNGRILRPEQSSLSELGLTDNCVVHCLVQRQTRTASNAGRPQGAASAGAGQDDLDLDLGSFCFPLLGIVLAVIWSCQLVYAHYFNFSSTAALVLLTVLFVATLANNYLPDMLQP